MEAAPPRSLARAVHTSGYTMALPVRRVVAAVVLAASSLSVVACAAEGEDLDASEGAASGGSGGSTGLQPPAAKKARTPFPEMTLAKEKQCFTCHAVDRKLVGPSFDDIATTYMREPTAKPSAQLVARLTKSVVKGSQWSFGAVPMPANPQIEEADAETLVRAILETGPGSCTTASCP